LEKCKSMAQKISMSLSNMVNVQWTRNLYSALPTTRKLPFI
jgi:hypothetical protein